MEMMTSAAVTFLTLGLASTLAAAQSGSGGGHGMGPPAAQQQQAPRPAPAPQARVGSDYTPGWSMMSKAEREEHRQRMREMKTYEECRAYLDQHREKMAARATEQARKALGQPRRDACAALKKP
jgi:hypothetical protein